MSLWTRMRGAIAPGAGRPTPPPTAPREAPPPTTGAPAPPAIRDAGVPDAFRDGGALVGSVTGSELLGISRDRFVRLARAGCFRPSRWYVNRYRAVVWLYPAREVTAFAEEHPGWLTGRLPDEVRSGLNDGLDLRAAGWRTRQAALIAARADDDRQAAAVWLALLGDERAADLLPDDRERARLTEARPSLLTGRPVSADAGDDPDGEVACAVALTARDPEEIAYAQARLAAALARLRALDATCAAGPSESAPNLCAKTVTRRGQRPRRRRSLSTRRGSPPGRPAPAPAIGPGERGDRRFTIGAVRPDQSKGRR